MHICGRHSLRPSWRRSRLTSSFDNTPFESLLVHMVTPASTQLHHGAACNIGSPVRPRRFSSVVPLRPCSTRPRCRSTSKHSLPICQAQAASVAEQSAPTSPAKRPRSPAKRGRKKSSNTEDDAVDTGEPGKRVVIVGGGWAGKSGHSQTCVDLYMHLFSCLSHTELKSHNSANTSVCEQVLVQRSTSPHKDTL